MVAAGGSASFTGCMFSGLGASNEAAVQIAKGGHASMRGCVVKGNDGGGVMIRGGGTANILGSIVSHNRGGPGVEFEGGGGGSVMQSLLEHNEAEGCCGGGLLAGDGGRGRGDGTGGRRRDGGGDGGGSGGSGGGEEDRGIASDTWHALAVDIRDCTIRSNKAQSGGGLCILGGNATVASTSVVGNTAVGGSGGGVLWQGGEGEISDCQVSSNVASRDGGGLWVEGASVWLRELHVWGNKATGGGGGGLYARGGAVLRGGVYERNEGWGGGDNIQTGMGRSGGGGERHVVDVGEGVVTAGGGGCDISSDEEAVQSSTDGRGRIFVSLVSFRDSECGATLLDMYDAALDPKRVYAGEMQSTPLPRKKSLLHPPFSFSLPF